MSEDQLTYLYNLERFGIQPGLERMEKIMEVLGHPEQKFSSIHVAGTNGKGSVVAMLDSILRKTSLKVGRYTSPHIYSFSERITVNGQEISDKELEQAIAVIRSNADRHTIHLTFFEFVTAIAFYYFAQQEVDIAVIEVGMGGLLDATNVITPEVSVITTIGLDHTEYLGPTIDLIAREKAGIIKQARPVVIGTIEGEAKDILLSTAKAYSSQVYESTKLISLEVEKQSLQGQHIQVGGEFTGMLELPLLGDHQLQNLRTALTTIHVLRKKGHEISWDRVVAGIHDTVWPARMQVVSDKPLLIIDGAHNIDGAQALRKYVETLPNRDVVIVGYKKGKDIEEMVQEIIPLFSHVIVSKGAYMPEDPEVIASIIRTYHKDVIVLPDITEAIKKAQALVRTEGTIVITGSLYLAADALQVLT